MLRSKKEFFRLDLHGSSFSWRWLPRDVKPPRTEPLPCTWTHALEIGRKYTADRCKIVLETSVAPVGPGLAPAIMSLCDKTLTDISRSHITVPLLKSALQKNVRRCRAQSAVRCAVAILQTGSQGFMQFIRLVCAHDSSEPTHKCTHYSYSTRAHY